MEEKMKNKKAILSLVMGLSLMNPAGIYAESAAEDSANMSSIGLMGDEMGEIKNTNGSELSEAKLEKIIKDVKIRLPIKDQNAEFNYSIARSYGQNYYNLNWETQTLSQQVRYGEDGIIYSYYSYQKMDRDTGQTTKQLPQYSQVEAAKIAQEFLGKCLLAEESKNFSLADNELNNGNHNLRYTYSKNKIPVENVTANITMNDKTGEVVSFSTSYDGMVKYDADSGLISTTKAEAVYQKDMGLKKIYTYDYDLENKSLKNVKIVYVPRLDSQYAIDAKTGQVVIAYGDRYLMSMDRGGMGGAMKEAASNLTPQERTEIQSKAGLKTMEEAQTAAQKMGLLPKEAKRTGTSLYERIYDESTYIWSLNYKLEDNYYGLELDAQNLTLRSFYGGGNYSNDKAITANDISKAKNAAENFIGKFAPKYQDKIDLNTQDLEKTLGTKNNILSLEYTRYENGAYLLGNGISLTYDIQQDKIVGYNLNWTKINLPKYSSYADESKVFKQIFTENKIGLSYKLVLDENSQSYQGKLYYEVQGDQPLVFSAQTGDRIQSESTSSSISYTDIADSLYKEEIKVLASLGIGFEGGKLAPKATVTQKELLDLILQTKQYYYPMPLSSSTDVNTAPYVSAGLLLKGETLNKQGISRQEGIKYIVRAAGYEKLAQHPEIFVEQLSDLDQVDKNLKAYVIIGSALGFTDTANNQKFNPKSNMTREVALKMIYNYLAQA